MSTKEKCFVIMMSAVMFAMMGTGHSTIAAIIRVLLILYLLIGFLLSACFFSSICAFEQPACEKFAMSVIDGYPAEHLPFWEDLVYYLLMLLILASYENHICLVMEFITCGTDFACRKWARQLRLIRVRDREAARCDRETARLFTSPEYLVSQVQVHLDGLTPAGRNRLAAQIAGSSSVDRRQA
jgi:hypothetical protein